MTFDIPVYYHIPKCGGTYILTASEIYAKIYGKNIGKNFGTLIIKKNDSIWYRIITTLYGVENYLIVDGESNKYETTIENYLKNRSENEFIFSIIVETENEEWSEVEKNLELKRNINSFTVIRDPFDRARSLFHYLNGEESFHEKNHKSLPDNFENFINSFYYDDSFIIRKFVKVEEQILDEDYKKFLDIVKEKNIKINTINKIEKIIKETHEKSYGLDCDLNNDIWWKNNKHKAKNKSYYKEKIEIFHLKKESKEFFYSRTKYDQLFYDYVNITQI